MMRASFLVAAAALAAAADPETIWQLHVDAGIAPGLIAGTVPYDNPVVGTYDHELTTSYRGGLAAGLGLARLSVDHDGNGWYLSSAVQGMRWMGSVTEVSSGDSSGTSDAAIAVSGGMLNLSLGAVWRWDEYRMRVMPEAWEFDIGPMAGIGLAQAQLEGSDDSDLGIAWQAGLHTRLSAALGGGWRLGGDCDLLYGEARVSWTNTGTATLTAVGPRLAMVLIREF